MARFPDDVHDEEEDQPLRPTDVRSSNTVFTFLAILGGVLLGILLVCGGLAALALYAVSQAAKEIKANLEQWEKDANRWQEAQNVGEKFLRELRRGDYDRAYALTSKDYQERVSRKALEDYVAKWPALRSPTVELTLENPGLGSRRIRSNLTDPQTGLDGRLVLVEENGSWKIDELEAHQHPH